MFGNLWLAISVIIRSKAPSCISYNVYNVDNAVFSSNSYDVTCATSQHNNAAVNIPVPHPKSAQYKFLISYSYKINYIIYVANDGGVICYSKFQLGFPSKSGIYCKKLSNYFFLIIYKKIKNKYQLF